MQKAKIDGLCRGDWCFLENNAQLHMAIRYGDDPFREVVVIPVSTVPLRNASCWAWNGDRISPTLTPSILVHEDPGFTIGWHGFLTAGELITV